MPERPNYFDTLKRFGREMLRQTTFIYDPNFTENTTKTRRDLLRGATAPNEMSASWKRNPNGSITVGAEEIEKAIMYADKMKSPDAKTAVGLSVKYIKEHFPRALKDAGYDE